MVLLINYLSNSTGENSKIRLNRNNNLSNYLDIVGGTQGGIYNINTEQLMLIFLKHLIPKE